MHPGQALCPAGTISNQQKTYRAEPQGVADGEGDSDDELSDGEGDAFSSLLFFEGEGDASELEAFFFVDELELLLVVPPVFLVVLEVVDFLVVAVEAAVVDAVSSLCAHETINATPASTAVNPRTNFFIVTGIFRLKG